MKAFVNTPITKEQFVNQLKWHQEQDSFISGTYSEGSEEDFKGCAVGCSIHSIARELNLNNLSYGKHSLYEEYLGVPEWLAYLEDKLFERMSESRQKTWPVEFGEAIPVGVNLDLIKHPFLIFVMEENLKILDSLDCETDEVRKAIELVIEYHKNPNEKARSAAESAAWSAAESAAWSTRSAVESAAWSARSAAWSARSAVESAAWSAWSAWSARSAAESARSAAESARSAAESAALTHAEKLADKLLELMSECKPGER